MKRWLVLCMALVSLGVITSSCSLIYHDPMGGRWELHPDDPALLYAELEEMLPAAEEMLLEFITTGNKKGESETRKLIARIEVMKEELAPDDNDRSSGMGGDALPA